MTLLRSERIGGFDALVLDSPANRNALSLQLLEELCDGVCASAESTSRGLVIGHTGPAFCSGVDLRERRELGRADGSHSALLGRLFTQLWNYPKPLVTTVSGAVRGGGMGLLSCSDVVIASPDSTFAYSETRVGVAPALVMAVTLPTVPTRRIMPWLLSGGVFTAVEARNLELVTTIDATSDTASCADIVAEFSKAAPLAQIAVKRLRRRLQNVDIEAVISEMTAESAALFDSAEAREGMASFAQRRPPSWATDPA